MTLASSAFAGGPSVNEQRQSVEAAADARAVVSAPLDGTVGGYVAAAIAANPSAEAAFYRWEAAVHRIARARSLPEPTLGFGVFLRSVETRVGPQQARLSLQQAFPWPTALMAGSDGASSDARAAQAMFDATARAIERDVQVAYWNLWEVRATRITHTEHLDVLDGLSLTLRARVEVGAATLADLQQVDLSRSRLADAIASMDARERSAQAALRGVVGLDDWDALATTSSPPALSLPAASQDALRELALVHPMVVAAEARVDGAQAGIRASNARRLPSFTVGLDYVVTGPAVMPDVADSGKDAVVGMIGLKVPLWQGAGAADVRAARAMQAVRGAEVQASEDQVTVALDQALAELADTARHAGITENTLLPQAEATYTSLLGSYAVSRAGVAQVLLAQRDLLDLRVDVERARASHARAWATLQDIVGSDIAQIPVSEVQP
jgi:outer membrane protein TolC